MLQTLLETYPEIKNKPDFISDFEKALKYKEFSKGHILHKAGMPGHYLYFIEKGLARVSYLQDGKDISCHFGAENEIVTPIDSFLKSTISQYNIELLEDTFLYQIGYAKLEELLDRHSYFERIFRMILTQCYQDLVNRLNDLQFHTARERYDAFFHKNPGLFQRISLGHIASYLGMTQETLSRMRNMAS